MAISIGAWRGRPSDPCPDLGKFSTRSRSSSRARYRVPGRALAVSGVSAFRLSLRRWTIKGLSRAHLAVLRLSRGRLLGRVAGMPVLVLTTTGRRSARDHATPLTFFRHGSDLVVIASNGGADRPPDWYLNL